MRIEHDALGTMEIPEEALHGIHTARARRNFFLAGRPVHPDLIRGMGAVKLAAMRTCRELGLFDDDPAAGEAIEAACREMAAGGLASDAAVDALQGGAGTSLNLAVCEVLANRALRILGEAPGRYDRISPLEDLNRFQSTNDTVPTAVRIAALWGLSRLEQALVGLQEAFQAKEREFAGVVKIGRTEMQDAVLVTLGREMGAYAEAFQRDRWRVYKCAERIRVVPLGGTAVGTGLGAPRRYIFRVVEVLREETGLPLAQAENLLECIQNADAFVEVSGILKACATNLGKVSSDLRLLSSGPQAGIGEIRLPARQEGSSIMPGKVNPVIPEAVTQAAIRVMALDGAIAQAAMMGSLELQPFLPLMADCLLESLDLLARSCQALADLCVAGIEADRDRCGALVESATATATALIPALGHARAAEAAQRARETGRTIREVVVDQGWLTAAEFDQWISPERVCRLGSPEVPGRRGGGTP
ncbi:MAG TPA: aspartate ammonia-lyase [Myxococcota bacterium]|nr:aspartate ammonia-lyase [Myxococcota bacterium]HQK52166.1 aspartate ammonia-lyase [Myxococcota bacterium]